MATKLELIGPQERDWFEPAGHWQVQSHWVVQDAEAARVQFCEMGAGGGADSHVHDDEDQVFYIIEGALDVEDGSGAHVVVRAGEAVRIPAGVPHATTSAGDGATRYLVVTLSAPLGDS